jgi:hypothetical protein
MSFPLAPLSPEATDLLARIRPKILADLDAVKRVPVSVLVWGPSPTAVDPVSETRRELWSNLRGHGHAAVFSEELYDPSCGVPIRIQQIAHAKEFDLIVSLPDSPGSIAEVHDFANDRRAHAKLLIFLNSDYLDGYSSQSLQSLSSTRSCTICQYNGHSDLSSVLGQVLQEVQRIRDLKYILEGRL